MAARFILSFDCEGKWGVADCLGPPERAALSKDNLEPAYRDILALLDQHEVPATFAFVGLFGESGDAFARLRPALEPLAAIQPNFLGAALRDIDDTDGDGWHGAWAVEAVRAARTRHELALHGITHVPWGDVDRQFAMAELSLHPLLSPPLRSAQTFIAPRNEVAHVDLLPTIGIRGYRAAPRARSRLRILLSEFNIWQRAQHDRAIDASGLVVIPSGYFVNWQHGLRRIVPGAVSVLRLERMLDSADRSGGVVHLWLHPENVARAPATLGLLGRMIEIASRRRNAGTLEVLTQAQYVEQRAGR